VADQPFEHLPFPTWDELWEGTRAWLEYQWGPDWNDRQCPYCGNPGWAVTEVVVLCNDREWPVP